MDRLEPRIMLSSSSVGTYALAPYVSDGTYVDGNGVQQLSGGDVTAGSNYWGGSFGFVTNQAIGFIAFDLIHVNIYKNSKVILDLSDTGSHTPDNIPDPSIPPDKENMYGFTGSGSDSVADADLPGQLLTQLTTRPTSGGPDYQVDVTDFVKQFLTSGARFIGFRFVAASPSTLEGFGLADGSGVFLEFQEKSDITPTPLAFDDSGGVKYGYTISNSDLPQATTVALYWAPTSIFDSSQDTLIPPSVATTQTAAGTYGPFHVTPAQLGAPPQGAKYLLAVTDPQNLISPADPSKVAALALPIIAPTVLTFDTNDGGVNFGYTISNADLPQATTVALYWAPDSTFDKTKDTLIPGSVTDTQTTIGAYASPHIDRKTLGVSPSGTRYLLAVADPDNKIIQSNTVKSVLSIDALPFILWHTLTPTGEGTKAFYVTFKPRIAGDNPIKDVEEALGVDHFNWISEITSVPQQWTLSIVDSRGRKITKRVKLPLIDPIVVSNPANPPHLRISSAFSRRSADVGGVPGAGTNDNLPYYWNEGSAAGEVDAATKANTFLFFDTPRVPSGFFRKNEFEGFKTRLVGVMKDGSYVDLTQKYGPLGLEFTWESDVTYKKSYLKATAGSISNVQLQ